VRAFNKDHAATRLDARLDARIAADEMAARLQGKAPEVLDISGESPATRQLYGLDEPITADLGRRCLVARRLLERDVRFVQIWSGADNGFPRRNWDNHENIARDHGETGRSMDQPVADRQQRSAVLVSIRGPGVGRGVTSGARRCPDRR
jgi:hypothetical protein